MTLVEDPRVSERNAFGRNAFALIGGVNTIAHVRKHPARTLSRLVNGNPTVEIDLSPHRSALDVPLNYKCLGSLTDDYPKSGHTGVEIEFLAGLAGRVPDRFGGVDERFRESDHFARAFGLRYGHRGALN
jgi:hypothetical protein